MQRLQEQSKHSLKHMEENLSFLMALLMGTQFGLPILSGHLGTHTWQGAASLLVTGV